MPASDEDLLIEDAISQRKSQKRGYNLLATLALAAIFAAVGWFLVFWLRPMIKSIPLLPLGTVTTSLLPAVTLQNQGKAFAQDVMNFFHKQLEASIPLWNSPVQDFAQNQLKKAIDQIMYKSSKPKDVLAAAQQACQNELKRVLKAAKP